ncbi:hypothetical protein QZH41_013029 [Actinostola sp. cb2023]|nr:hypothetical protein QZH41_013029 [Actinostola sp. cb2023]
MVSQSIYIFIYYVNSRDKKNVMLKILWSFLGVTSVLSYVKYYVQDTETAIIHLGFVSSGFSVAVYGSPLVSLLPNGLGVLLSSVQLSLFVCYPTVPQKTITYTPDSKPSKLEV